MIDEIYLAPAYCALSDVLPLCQQQQMMGLELLFQPSHASSLRSGESGRSGKSGPNQLHSFSHSTSSNPIRQNIPSQIPLTLRLDGVDLNPVSPDAEIAAVSRSRYIEAIQWAEQADASYLLLPSLDLPLYRMNGQYRLWLANTIAFWEGILASCLSHASRLTLVLVNQQDPAPDTLMFLIDRLNHPRFKAGLDTGNIRLHSNVSSIDWLDKLQQQTAYVRLIHNNGQTNERLPLETDDVDLPAFINHLALLNIKFPIALGTDNQQDLISACQWLDAYLKIQSEQYQSKRFLI